MATLVAGITAITLIATMAVNAWAAHAMSGGVSITLDNVNLSIQSPTLPSTTFTVSPAGSLTVGATSTSLNPFRSLSIVTVPYGTVPNELSLPQAATGSADVYAASMHARLVKEHAQFAPGPTANLFGTVVTGEASRLHREVPGVSGYQIVDSTEWITEAGNRVWIVTQLDQVGASQSLGSHANQFAAGLVISSDNPGAATGIGQASVKNSAQAPFVGASFLQSGSGIQAALQTGQSPAIPATVAQTNTLDWPDWWSGTCNGNNTGSSAGKYLVTTGQGVLSGLQICAENSSIPEISVSVSADGGTVYEWQCTELSSRYMDVEWHVPPTYPYDAAYDIASNFPQSTYPYVTYVPNSGVAGVIPMPGDVVQMSTNASSPYPGHTGVIESTNVNSSGSGYVVLDSENGNQYGRYNLYVGAEAGLAPWMVGGDGVNITTAWLHNTGDRLFMFERGSDGKIYEQNQTSPGGSWNSSGYTPFGNPSGVTMTGNPATGMNHDGRLFMFVRGSDGKIYLQEQTSPGGSWLSGYTSFSNPSGITMTGDPVIGMNSNGRMFMFVLGVDGQIYLQEQTSPGGAWLSNGYTQFANPYGVSMTDNPAIGMNYDGRMFMFVRGSDGEVHLQYQTAPGGAWLSNGYTQFSNSSGVSMYGQPAIGVNSDDRLFMFVRGTDGEIHLQEQTTPGGPWLSTGYTQFSNPSGITMTGDPATGINSDGRMYMFVRGSDGEIHLQYQTAPGGSWLSNGYTQFGNPSGITMPGNPAIGKNSDGRLFMFVRGSDGEVHLQYQTTPGGAWLSTGYTQFGNPSGITMAGDPAIDLSM